MLLYRICTSPQPIESRKISLPSELANSTGTLQSRCPESLIPKKERLSAPQHLANAIPNKNLCLTIRANPSDLTSGARSRSTPS